MKKSAQDREIEKLKKQVEKTQERERISSKRQTQSQGKVVHCSVKQCQVSFCTQKKRETERWIGQGDFRTNDESIGRHHYSSLMVALSVAFYARLSVGSRQIVEIFNILNGENGAFPPTRDGCIHSLSMRERG